MSDDLDEACETTGASHANEPIALVGIGCRYADARGPEEFWEIVRTGRNTVRDAPQHRIELGYDIDHFYDPRPRIPGKISSKKGGFLEHPELFDPTAFGIAPRDALTMEPQQRLMVEVTWDALEDAGIVPDQIKGERVAVILGYMAEDYSRERAGVLGEEAVYRGHDVFTVGGMSHAVLSGRIAFLLGVTGPSFTLDTACSSSLIATHLACQSLRRGESNLALAGGVNLFLSPEGNIALSRSGMLSMSGSCRAFDAGADGFVRAEGAGVVVLQRLSDAIRDGNPIYSVIRGSGISSDGRDGGHMMAPGRLGQAQAMRDAYAQSGVDPASIHYVETHGTGTMIGDPVEIGALADVMGPGRDPERPLRVASVKGNLGHTESASGVAGLIRASLSMHHRELHGQLHYETPNPIIPWSEIPVRVQDEAESWPFSGPALVGVNSFGISGTNAHVVLESPPESLGYGRSQPKEDAGQSSSRSASRPIVLPISGHDSSALHDMVVATRARLENSSAEDFADVAYTYAERRTHHAHRLTVSAMNPEGAREELDAYLAGEPSSAVQTGISLAEANNKLVMVFPGQGSQWVGMGRELIDREPVFAASIDRLDVAFSAHVDWSLRSVLLEDADFDWRERLDVLQPLLVAVEIALAELWSSFGIRAARVVGQSMGEIAAAFVAGILSEADMARLACHRGKIVARAAGHGSMAVVGLARADTQARLSAFDGTVEVAGINSPTTTIVSGDQREVATFVDSLESEGVFARLLAVDFASHCFHMDPLLDDFRAGIEGIQVQPAKIPFDSSVDGFSWTDENRNELGPDYWVQNLRSAVAFDLGLARSIEGGGEIFLEVSPHPTMPRAIDEVAKSIGAPASYVSSLTREASEQESLARNLATLHVFGVEVDFAAWGPGGRVARVPLYAYQRERYWFSERSRIDRRRPNHPLLGAVSVSSIDTRLRTWDFVLDQDSAEFVEDLRVQGACELSAGFCLELALAAGSTRFGGQSLEVRDLEMHRPIHLGRDGRRMAQVVLRNHSDDSAEISISSRSAEEEHAAEWELHASAKLHAFPLQSAEAKRAKLDRSENASVPTERFIEAVEGGGLSFGPKAKTLREIEADDCGAILGKFMLPRTIEAEWHAFETHPALLENAFQLGGLLGESDSGIRVQSIERVALQGGLGSDCWCRVSRREGDADYTTTTRTCDYEFFDREGNPLGGIEGVRLRILPATRSANATTSAIQHHVSWQEQTLENASAGSAIERWILISDDADEAAQVASELLKRGAECRFCEKAENLEALAHWMSAQDSRPWGLAVLAWKAGGSDGAPEPEGHRAFRIGSWADSIRKYALSAREIWIATRGLQSLDGGVPALGDLGWHIALEIETFTDSIEMQRCRLFDASDTLAAAERNALAVRMGVPSEERQFVARGQRVLVPRLVSTSSDRSSGERGTREAERAGARNFSAIQRQDGSGIAQLLFTEVADSDPAPREVIVEVRAAALSQLDVLSNLGLSKNGDSGKSAVARDFSGVVRAVGADVSDLVVGDEVVGIREGALSRRIRVDRTCLVRKPSLLDFAEAASLPFPFLVARYALSVVGRLRAGERCLLRSTGGGIAFALQDVARSIGADLTVLAPDGSSEESAPASKVRFISTLDSTADVSGGGAPGVGLVEAETFDVIVGTGSGPEMHGLIERLASGGRYLDLCPRLHFDRPEIGALRLGANRSISAIDTQELIRNDPELVSALLEETIQEVERGDARSMPVTVFPIRATGRALRWMAQNRHKGRVCVDLQEAERVEIETVPQPIVPLSERGGFLVSGEAGRLQDAIVAWLASTGVEPVVLSSDESIVRSFEMGTGSFARRAGWIHIGRDSQGQGDSLRERLVQSDAPLRILISIRSEMQGDPEHDRAWETQLWVDQLSHFRARQHGGWVDLSVSEEGDTEPVVEFLGRASRGEIFDSPVVLMDAGEVAQRRSTSPSPILLELGDGAGDRGTSSISRNEFLKRTPPEQRIEMQAFVMSELAGVLGLTEEQKQSLDPLSRLDALGLDSLMSMELFVGLGRSLEIEIDRDWFESIPSIAEIGSILALRYVKSDGGA